MKGQDKQGKAGYDWLMGIVLKHDWAKAVSGVKIPLFQSAPMVQAGLLFIGGVHGDEPEGVELANKTLAWLKDNSEKVQTPWVLIPCLNPDGIALAQRVNANAVDLNRNYPSKDWNAQFTKARYYPGKFAGSEPEIKALIKFIDEMQPQLIIHCHSWHPCVVYAGPPAKKISDLIGQHTGYESRCDIGYPTPGSLSSYAWDDKKIPVICIEEQEGCPREEIWPRFQKPITEVFLNFNNLMEKSNEL